MHAFDGRRRPLLVMTAVLGLAMIISSGCGCRPNQPDSPKEDGQRPGIESLPAPSGGAQREAATPAEPVPVDLPSAEVPDAVPEVRMTESDLATCRVRVGDAMPAAPVQELSGRTLPLRSFYGSRATVVAFWTTDGGAFFATETAKGLLTDLQTDVAEVFGSQGVGVVAVNQRDPLDVVRDLLGQVEITFPVVVDPQQALFQSVATEHLPRVYVLDAQGKILWFDIEYSETTRDELLKTLRFVTGDAAP